ncbi:Pentatricopeptide repeat-containing protein At2g02980, chloroplastic [Linum perenne]
MAARPKLHSIFLRTMASNQTPSSLQSIVISNSFPTLCFSSSSIKENNLISLLKKSSTIRDINQLHAQAIQSGHHQSLFLVGKIVMFSAVSEPGNMGYAASVFETITTPDGFLWNVMIRGFVKSGEPRSAFDYYRKMQAQGFKPDNFTFSFVLKVCAQLESLSLAKQMHCNVLKHGLDSHVFVRNTLVHVYGMVKQICECRQLFDEIPQPKVVEWNTMIDCLVYCGESQEALRAFSRMLRFGLDPDEATLVGIISACSASGELDFGRWIHSCIKNSNLCNVLQLNNSLVDMYAKCGALEEAYEVFTTMNKKNTVTWNVMLSGLATHGHTKEALVLFNSMLEHKVVPLNDVTFLVVLSACRHGGLVEEGRKIFNTMLHEHGMEPTIKHYGCMVDILARAGFVEEAYQLIRRMPMGCNAIVWRTLLAACSLHGNVELGELVKGHLVELDPEHSSDFVLLANAYASTGQWNDVIRLRNSMQERGVRKPQPGNSSVS